MLNLRMIMIGIAMALMLVSNAYGACGDGGEYDLENCREHAIEQYMLWYNGPGGPGSDSWTGVPITREQAERHIDDYANKYGTFKVTREEGKTVEVPVDLGRHSGGFLSNVEHTHSYTSYHGGSITHTHLIRLDPHSHPGAIVAVPDNYTVQGINKKIPEEDPITTGGVSTNNQPDRPVDSVDDIPTYRTTDDSGEVSDQDGSVYIPVDERPSTIIPQEDVIPRKDVYIPPPLRITHVRDVEGGKFEWLIYVLNEGHVFRGTSNLSLEVWDIDKLGVEGTHPRFSVVLPRGESFTYQGVPKKHKSFVNEDGVAANNVFLLTSDRKWTIKDWDYSKHPIRFYTKVPRKFARTYVQGDVFLIRHYRTGTIITQYPVAEVPPDDATPAAPMKITPGKLVTLWGSIKTR